MIAGATSVWVTSDDGRVLPALIVGSDPRSDLAILRVPGATTPIAIGEDADPTRGDVVVTLGNPAGLATGGTVSASIGTISATHRALPALSAKEKRFYDDLASGHDAARDGQQRRAARRSVGPRGGHHVCDR